MRCSELHQPRMIDRVEEAADIRIQHPVYLPLGDSHPDRIQRFMLAAFRSESVAESEKVLLLDLVQYPYHRLLDYLVLQRGYPDWSLSTIRLGYPYPLRGLCPISATLYPVMEVRYPALQTFTILLPCHIVHSGCCVTLERMIASRSSSAVIWCMRLVKRRFLSLAAASRILSSPFNAFPCLRVQVADDFQNFPLVTGLPSGTSATT